jgi:hypothetical protein
VQSRADGVPPLFFFDEASLPAPAFDDTPAALAVARRHPEWAQAWVDVGVLADDAFTLLAADVHLRHLARALPELAERLHAVGRWHRRCRHLAELLAIADDCVIEVVFPHEIAGFCVSVTGIADVAQFHILLADAIHGDPHRGFLIGARPDPRLVDACRFEPADVERDTATAVFQFHRPTALTSDGRVPAGLDGYANWIWGHESLMTVPVINGVRRMLATKAVYARRWTVGRKFAAVEGSLEVVDVMTEDAVMETLQIHKQRLRAAA